MTYDTHTRERTMKKDLKKTNKELKKDVATELRDMGYINDEIRRALGCTERTLYRWQSEDIDDEQQKEIEQQTEELEQKQQKEIDEIKERLDNLSRYYENLWKEKHTPEKPTEQDKAEAIILQMMLERSFKNDKLLELQRQRTREIWETHQWIEQNPIWNETEYTEGNARWQRLMDKWDGKMERKYRYPQQLQGYQNP